MKEYVVYGKALLAIYNMLMLQMHLINSLMSVG